MKLNGILGIYLLLIMPSTHGAVIPNIEGTGIAPLIPRTTTLLDHRATSSTPLSTLVDDKHAAWKVTAGGFFQGACETGCNLFTAYIMIHHCSCTCHTYNAWNCHSS